MHIKIKMLHVILKLFWKYFEKKFRNYFEKQVILKLEVNFKFSWKIFCCRHQKNASHKISFFIWYDTPTFMSKHEKISLKLDGDFSKVYEICKTSVFS